MTGPEAATAPPLPRRDRVAVLGALAALAAWAWLWLLSAGDMTMPMGGTAAGPGLLMPGLHAWTPARAWATFVMWAIMMVGMMVPSVAPMVLLHARVMRRGLDAWRAHGRTALFVAGYLAAWTAFSALATAAQWGLDRLALLTPMTAAVGPVLGGALVALAGLYQWTPAKGACLAHCRAPVAFVTGHWRPGAAGAFVMGLDHGTYCLGCCWMLMALLFVVGVMNLAWVALIAAFVLAEKIVPHGLALARAAGAAMIPLGLWLAVAGG